MRGRPLLDPPPRPQPPEEKVKKKKGKRTPSTWSFSVFSLSSVMKSGKYAFFTPDALMRESNHAWIDSQTEKDHGRRM